MTAQITAHVARATPDYDRRQDKVAPRTAIHRRQGNGNANGQGNGNAQGGNAQGGNAQGGNAQGGNAQGGNAAGNAQGGNAQGGNAGNAQGNGNGQSQSQSQSQSQPSSSSSSIPYTAPAGGVTFTQPPQSATSFYKLAQGETITIGWNYTYLLVTPTHITMSAVCADGNTFPVGPTDGVLPGTATSVLWDVYSYNQAHQSTPIAPSACSLTMWGDKGSAAPQAPGELAPTLGPHFAFYTPQPYTPLASGWSCADCSGSLSSYTAHPAFTGLVATFLIVFLSGFGLLRHFIR